MTETPLESTSTPRRATLDEREKQLLEVQHQLITRNAELATALSKLDRRSWQPIDTAPRDERVIIAKIAESVGKWAGDVGRGPHVWFAVTATHNGRYWTDGLDKLVEPTHWMELPEVPQCSATQSQDG